MSDQDIKILAIAIEFFMIGFIIGGLFMTAYFVRKNKEGSKNEN